MFEDFRDCEMYSERRREKAPVKRVRTHFSANWEWRKMVSKRVLIWVESRERKDWKGMRSRRSDEPFTLESFNGHIS